MRILYATDVHSNFGGAYLLAKAKNFDAILLGGDFLSFPDLVLLRDLLFLFQKLSEKEIYFVPGNWEPIEILLWNVFGKTYNLHGRISYVGGHVVCGIGGVAPRRSMFPLEFESADLDYYLFRLERKRFGMAISLVFFPICPLMTINLYCVLCIGTNQIGYCMGIPIKGFLGRTVILLLLILGPCMMVIIV